MLVCHLNKTKEKNYLAFSLRLFHNCRILLKMKLKLHSNNKNTQLCFLLALKMTHSFMNWKFSFFADKM